VSQTQKLPPATPVRRSKRRSAEAEANSADLPGARERILAAAQELFYANGYSATSVASIADAARMTTPNLYWHFPSKQALLVEVLDRAQRNGLKVLLQGIPESGTAMELLAAYVRAYVRMQLSEARDGVVHGYWILAADLPASEAPRLREGRREIHRVLRNIVQQGIAEGTFEVSDPTLAVTTIETSCEYVFTWFTPAGRLSDEEVLDGMIEIALRIVGYRATGL
jgi:TetR/AcrR family transcriptional regulator, cholesterol catabolism regulator